MSNSTTPGLHPAPTAHAGLVGWVEQIAALAKPDRVHWCDGSEAEKQTIIADLLAKGTLTALDQTKRPGSSPAMMREKTVVMVGEPTARSDTAGERGLSDTVGGPW